MKWYSSPRWTKEILDCSMPMTFDTYNKCSYDCLYCFSYFQKSHTLGAGGASKGKHDYQKTTPLTSVNPDVIKRLFALDPKMGKSHKQFFPYIRRKKVMQWGGLADQFDQNERKYGRTLKLLEFFKKIDYPLCFSTKATWWAYDKRYARLFRNQNNWNTKFSIINLDKKRSREMERGVPSPAERLNAMRVVSELNRGGATLRLRPFIIGVSDRNDEYLELIRMAEKHGATAVTVEFMCIEGRADERLKARYRRISDICRFDVLKFYRQHSRGSGYMRLSRKIKHPYIRKMYNLCKKLRLRFYVSDAHFKEYCANGSCCGLPESFNYSRGQFTEALMIAKVKGHVRYSDISKEINSLHNYPWIRASGYNTSTAIARAVREHQAMKDFIREMWNTPKKTNSPYKYFGGILVPVRLDKNKDVIYEYRGEQV